MASTGDEKAAAVINEPSLEKDIPDTGIVGYDDESSTGEAAEAVDAEKAAAAEKAEQAKEGGGHSRERGLDTGLIDSSKWRRHWYQFWMPKDPPPPAPASLSMATEIPLATANIFSVLTYTWISPIMTLGYQRPLQATDLWRMDASRRSELLSTKLAEAWDRRCQAAAEYNARVDAGEIRLNTWKRLQSHMPWHSKLDASGHKMPSLAWALNDVFGVGFWAGGLFKVFGDTAQLMAPLLAKSIIQMVEGTDVSIARGVPMAIGLSLLTIMASLCQHQFFFRSMHTGVLARAALITALYKRAMKLSPKARTTFTNGALINHLSTDVSRIDYCAQWFHAGWTAPIQVCICLIILCVQLGPSALAGFAVFLILMPAQERAMSYQLGVRTKSMFWTDKRAKLLQELLGGMRIIKVFCYEIPFLERITSIRAQELKGVWKISIIRAANQAMAFSVPVLAAVLAFVTYSLTGHDLEPAVIFTSMSLFQLLRQPLMFLPRALSSITDASHAMERLRNVFLAEMMDEGLKVDEDSKWAVRVDGAEFQWETVISAEQREGASKKGKGGKEKEKEKEKEKARKLSMQEKEKSPYTDEPFALRDINMRIPRGSLVAIVGPVGSGKSSLLQGLLGEMRRAKGEVVFGGSVGYCAQMAWIQNATLRENVLFGREYNEEKYWNAIRDASLLADLEQLPDGDLTEIGEKGINLSGGQKQRVNIARALYYDADIVALDDPLSAVDAHVGRALFSNAVLGALKDRGKTVILVTHALHFLPQVDYIYTFLDGVIAEQGTYEELVRKDGAFCRLVKQFAGEAEEEKRLEELEKEREAEEGTKAAEAVAATNAIKSKMTKQSLGRAKGTGRLEGRLIQAERRSVGSVKRGVYAGYLKAGGGIWSVLFVLLMNCVMQGCSVMATYWLVWWQEDTFMQTNAFYMGIYAALGLGQAFFTLAMGVSLAWLSYLASASLHRNATNKVFHAPMSFFDTTPLGRILSVFGKDVDTIDNLLTESLRMFAMTISNVLGTIIIVTVVTHYFILAVAVILVGYAYFFEYYTTSSRELKRLDASLRSLLYSHYSESLSGLVTIRAYQETGKFLRDNEYYTDLEDRALIPIITNQRWLAVRVDFLGALMILAVGLMTVLRVNGISAAQTGLVLSYMTSLTQAFSMLTRQSAEVENNMNGVERIIHYTSPDYIAQEAPYTIPDQAPPADWPKDGAVEFKGVRLRYRTGLEEVLKGVDWSVRPGEKVGVVGRTGAGKSSLLIALYRLVELSGGSISIDGIDISRLGLQELRSRLSIIPQDPLLFSGTIRTNLDPFNQYDDARLWDALRRSYLVESPAMPVSSASSITAKEDVLSAASAREDTMTLLDPKGEDHSEPPPRARFHLETLIDAEGANLSVGERSLVSLARALVRDARIIVLDEATASVDLETDDKIQKVIREDFKDRTLITIAHRLRTILSYDTILVMDNGLVAELDTPMNLFLKESGIFRSMCERSNITREEVERAREAS